MKLLSNIQKIVITIIPMILLIAGFSTETTAQKLQLVIGKYDCTTNGDCGSDQFCDIDTHRCIHYTDRAECPTPPETGGNLAGSDGSSGADDASCSDWLTSEKCTESGLCTDCSDLIKPEECPVKTITCALGQVNYNNTCVECANNSNCPSDKPICNNENTCVSCENGTHWNGSTCIGCGGNTPVWNENTKKCVTCISNGDCNGKCDTITNTCTSCFEQDPTKPIYNKTTNACEACPSKSPFWNQEDNICVGCASNERWSEHEKACVSQVTCTQNTDCAKLGTGYYCYMYFGTRDTEEFDGTGYESGICRNAINDVVTPISATKFVKSSKRMTLWSGERFCSALGKTMIEFSDYDCKDGAYKIGHYCHENTAGNLLYDANNVSAVAKELYNAYGEFDAWTNTHYKSGCKYVLRDTGLITYQHLHQPFDIFCK